MYEEPEFRVKFVPVARDKTFDEVNDGIGIWCMDGGTIYNTRSPTC